MSNNLSDGLVVSEFAGGGEAPAGRATRGIRLTAQDCIHRFTADAIASEKNTSKLLYLSISGSQTALKAARAVLGQPKEQFELACADSDAGVFGTYHRFGRDGDGYKSFTVPVGMGTHHMVLMSKRKGFLPCISEEAVWQEISSSRYSTPLLKVWSKPIYERMLKLPMLLQKTVSWGCECGLLNGLTDARLDQLVIELLQQGKMDIGGHRVPQPPPKISPTVQCYMCLGRGKRWNSRSLEDAVCYECNGKGRVEQDDDE